ncbi:MAG: hypothetical protein JO364_17090 [Pseudonocardiales bacterium]|nr:hypothetical protein [Pseudonocardiales bacterium]MBV9031976.1 hypothetical protein [Pseudonocardiales bacterium]
MTAPGPQDPTIAYLAHRGMLIVVVLTIALSTGYLVCRGLPDLRLWVTSAIAAVRDEWTSWHWSLL